MIMGASVKVGVRAGRRLLLHTSLPLFDWARGLVVLRRGVTRSLGLLRDSTGLWPLHSLGSPTSAPHIMGRFAMELQDMQWPPMKAP